MTIHAQDGRAALLREAIRLKRAAARSPAPQLPPRPAEEDARLGELQRSLWLAHRLDPASPAYHLTSAFRAPGPLDPARLERGLNRVVARHRLLRSTFRERRGTVLQVVHPHAPLRLDRIEAGPGEAPAAAVREARRPFDLEAGPLVRLLLVDEPEAPERLLVLVLHHILADERSLRVLWRELAAGYEGLDAGTPDAPQYDDWVHWQETTRDPEQRAAELEAWRRRLDPPPAELRLPFERSAPEPRHGDVGAARGRLLSRALDPAARRGVRRLAAAAGTTPFGVSAFAFRLLLQRYTGGRDVAFATPASLRSHPATAEMIGYFLNPAVIRAGIDEGRPVGRAVADFGRRTRDALARAPVPFDVLAGELAAPRSPGRHPVFQAMFVYQEAPPALELGGLRLEPVTLDLGESKFDLTLFAAEGGSAAEIAVEYRADRFDEVWMRGLLGHYETLLHHLAADPERRVAEVPMLSPEETARLAADAQGPPLATAGPALLPRQILERARRSPRAPAVAGGGETWSYRDLERAAGRVAGELRRRGVGAGDRVGLFLDRSPRMIAGLLGTHWAGAAYVPLDPAYPSARNRAVLDDAEVAAVLTRAALLDRLAAGPWPAIDVEDLGGGEDLDGEANPPAVAEIRAGHPAYLLYTSGSTGRPKGVVVTHGGLRASNAARSAVYDAPPERFLLLPSVAFDSSVAGIFWTLAAGGTLVIPADDEARDPRRLARRIVDEAVTGLLCVPSLWGHLLAAGGERLEGLEAVIVAGESCPRQLVEDHFRVLPATRLFNEYGPTEATVWATVHEIGRDAAGPARGGPIPIGRPIPGVRVEVLDELGRRVPAGVPGQGWIAGPTLAEGYWRRPELTAESFVRRRVDGAGEERMYRTGDRLCRTAAGELVFLGRADDQIKLRGFRIEPGEIEAALVELPEVEAAAVVARGEQLVAFVEAAGPAPSWREELARRLPEFMLPGRLVAVAELPRLPNGKVDRGRLRAMPLDPEAPPAENEAPVLDEREQSLISLWEGLLGRAGVAPGDNFFQLGGHSLLAVEMAAAVERDFGVGLTPAEVFQHPTVRELARRIGQEGRADAPAYAHLFPLQPGGGKAPFVFAIPHFFAHAVAARFRGERPVYGLRGVGLRPEGNRGRWPTMRHLGGELVDEIARRFPGESCVLAGYSFGATMAVEAARLMEERGLPPRRLILIAPMPLDFFRLGPLRFQLDGLRQPVGELSPARALGRFARDHHPFTRRPYRRARRLLAVQPWRRLLCLVGRLRTLAGLPLTPRILWADVRVERFRLHAGYRPGTVRAPTVFFNAAEPETDAAATWRPHFAGPFTVHEIPDPHLGAAQVEAAKREILRHLDDLETA